MFLNSLNNSQKFLFIELAIKAAESNGIVPIEQKNMLKAFAIEMGISPVYHTERETETIIDEIIKISSEKELKIILFETLGIIVSDNVFDEKERMFVKNIVEKCNIDADLIDEMVKLLNKYASVYQEIVDLVL